MLGWFVRRQMTKFERDFDYDLTYARDMYDASPRAFFRFSRISGLAAHRENVPRETWFAAKIAATLAEDCGPCTQLVVTMAEREGVSPDALRAFWPETKRLCPRMLHSAFASRGRFSSATLRKETGFAAKLFPRWGKKGFGLSGTHHRSLTCVSRSEVRPWPWTRLRPGERGGCGYPRSARRATV